MTQRDRACDGKVRYLSKAYAREARRQMIGRGALKGRSKLSVYQCEYCNFWHLGHMPTAVRNGKLDKDAWLDR